MFDFFYWITDSRAEQKEYEQHIAALQAQANCARREFEEQRHAYYTKYSFIIDVEARIIDDIPKLPAPEGGDAPCSL